jgi:hypothetical protein
MRDAQPLSLFSIKMAASLASLVVCVVVGIMRRARTMERRVATTGSLVAEIGLR